MKKVIALCLTVIMLICIGSISFAAYSSVEQNTPDNTVHYVKGTISNLSTMHNLVVDCIYENQNDVLSFRLTGDEEITGSGIVSDNTCVIYYQGNIDPSKGTHAQDVTVLTVLTGDLPDEHGNVPEASDLPEGVYIVDAPDIVYVNTNGSNNSNTMNDNPNVKHLDVTVLAGSEQYGMVFVRSNAGNTYQIDTSTCADWISYDGCPFEAGVNCTIYYTGWLNPAIQGVQAAYITEVAWDQSYYGDTYNPGSGNVNTWNTNNNGNTMNDNLPIPPDNEPEIGQGVSVNTEPSIGQGAIVVG